MQVATFDNLASFRGALAAAGNGAAERRFFRSPDWFACLTTHGMARETAVRIYWARTGARSCWLACRVAEGGRALDSLTSFYSIDYGAGGAGGGAEDLRLLEAIARCIADERPRWRAVTLWNIFGDEERDRLISAFRSAGLFVRADAYNATWSVALGGQDYDAYLGRRPSRLQNTLRRRGREAERRGIGFRLHREADAAALAAFMGVYAASWKVPEPFPDFVPELCRTAARAGLLRLGLLGDGEQTVAAQLWIVDGDRAVIYKLAHRNDAAELSPGTLLTARMVEHVAMAEGLARISFGYGGEAYKGDWMEEREAVHAVEACPRLSLRAVRLLAADLRRRLAGQGDQASSAL